MKKKAHDFQKFFTWALLYLIIFDYVTSYSIEILGAWGTYTIPFLTLLLILLNLNLCSENFVIEDEFEEQEEDEEEWSDLH